MQLLAFLHPHLAGLGVDEIRRHKIDEIRAAGFAGDCACGTFIAPSLGASELRRAWRTR
jgi:hypothetical protein